MEEEDNGKLDYDELENMLEESPNNLEDLSPEQYISWFELFLFLLNSRVSNNDDAITDIILRVSLIELTMVAVVSMIWYYGRG